jgi:hypothetical protein
MIVTFFFAVLNCMSVFSIPFENYFIFAHFLCAGRKRKRFAPRSQKSAR